jgi:hypothetical protein
MWPVLLAVFFGLLTARAADVRILRTPNGGIQPQAAVDAAGTVHLIYYKGNERGGDIFYVRRRAGEKDFSPAIRVNTHEGTAIALGSIRGAQLAIGKNGRVHVVWDGMGTSAQKMKVGDKEAAPLLYARMNDAGTAFEPEKNVITYAFGLDGGSSVAADRDGNVYVAWHGRAPDAPEGEKGRALFVARSSDEGKTFEREKRAISKEIGACACCGMRAFADSKGAVYILYRAATDGTERGETLLVSPKPGTDFRIAFTHPWQATICPMSSAGISESNNGALITWETGDQVYFGRIDSGTMRVSTPVTPAPGKKRKHPAAVENPAGETLLVWTEGTAWAKGGSLGWQVFDSAGKPITKEEHTPGVPVWSLVTAFPNPDGGFTIVY